MDDVIEHKQTLTERRPTPVCTLMNDGSVQVEQDQIPLLTLQRMLLGAASNITASAVQRAANMERTLAMVQARFALPEDAERAIAAALATQAPPVAAEA
jgi:hypothetical protein